MDPAGDGPPSITASISHEEPALSSSLASEPIHISLNDSANDQPHTSVPTSLASSTLPPTITLLPVSAPSMPDPPGTPHQTEMVPLRSEQESSPISTAVLVNPSLPPSQQTRQGPSQSPSSAHCSFPFFDGLPDAILEKIFSTLAPPNLYRCSKLSRRMREIASRDTLWYPLFLQYMPQSAIAQKKPNLSWKQYYLALANGLTFCH